MTNATSSRSESPLAAPRDVRRTACCVVGAGPAGAVLALLQARQGIPVVLLEAQGDFERDFRGDTVHPAILEALDAVGVADRLLAAVPHRALRTITVPTAPPVRQNTTAVRDQGTPSARNASTSVIVGVMSSSEKLDGRKMTSDPVARSMLSASCCPGVSSTTSS